MDVQDKIIAKLTTMDIKLDEVIASHSKTAHEVSSLANSVEGFIKLHETMDCEVTALRSRNDRFDDRLTRVEKTLELKVA
jgi:hypothetical protein